MPFDTSFPLYKLPPEYRGPGKSSLLPTPGNLPLLGQYLTSYWEQKKLMAPGCEPLAVQRMMDVLAPYAYGQSLAGAGGGGFLYLLTKEPRQKEALEAVLAKTEVCAALRVGSWLEWNTQLWPTNSLSSKRPGSCLKLSQYLLSYLGPWQLQCPSGGSGHSGPEPAART